MDEPVILTLLSQTENWQNYNAELEAFRASSYYVMFRDMVLSMDRSILFQSYVHGEGHIERTLCHGALLAMYENLSDADTRLLLLACAYHDIGRINDRPDNLHGNRAAQRLPEVTDLIGDALHMVQGAVDAHSRTDTELSVTVQSYQPEDYARAELLAILLKDADGLDRVRIWDLNPAYLRRRFSRTQADFAKELYIRYQRFTNNKIVPGFVQEWKHIDEEGNPL